MPYAPDVIVLQEMNADVYVNLFRPTLEARGYKGYCVRKGAEEEGDGGIGDVIGP